jgi:stage III sporulation protein AG
MEKDNTEKDNSGKNIAGKKKNFLKEIGLPKLIMIFAAGILFILLSFPNILGGKDKATDNNQDNNSAQQQNDTNTTSYDTNTYISEMENKLKSILSKVSGIGEVEVMISLKASKELVPLKDSPYTQESLNEVDGEGGSRTDSSIKREDSTVLTTTEDGNSEPYIIQELEPDVEGVLVIAEGGDNAEIQLEIVEAAEVLFNVPAHKVKVMKMKDGIN